MAVEASLLESLSTTFGFQVFRPGQLEAVTHLENGENTLVVMPTGSGKSLIYQLVAVRHPGVTLVISPLIALMKDQVDALERHHISATYINSSLSSPEQAARLAKIAQGGYRLVYVAPERLRQAAFLNAVRYQKVSLLVIDEAHCISEWGHDFRPDYLQIAQARAAFGNPLTVALTATATPKVQKDILKQLALPENTAKIVTGFNRPNLSLTVQYKTTPEAKLRTLSGLLGSLKNGGAIIYTGTRRDAEEVAEFSSRVVGKTTDFYHAGLPTEERSRIQEAFLSGRSLVVVATNAFGMGIDRPDVRQVIHYSLPGSLEAYYQEAGRAGRDGMAAQAILLYDPKDRALQEWFIENGATTRDELYRIYHAIPSTGQHAWMTVNDVCCETGMQAVKVKLGLSELERAGLIEHLGEDGLRIRLRRQAWDEQKVHHAVEGSRRHQENRRSQLAAMIGYSETNACRRTIILRYFGDTGGAEAPDCCDNCRAVEKTSPSRVRQAGGDRTSSRSGLGQDQPPSTPLINTDQLTLGERAALIILDTIRRNERPLGRRRLAQILHTSTAAGITRNHYDQHPYYGKLAAVRIRYIEEWIDELIAMGYLKVIGGKYPVIALTTRGEAAIKNKSPIQLELPRGLTEESIEQKKNELAAGGTLDYTAVLFAKGLRPDEIALQRGLSPITIYGHLARLIEEGRLSVEQIVPPEILSLVAQAIETNGSRDAASITAALSQHNVDTNLVRCAVAGLQEPINRLPEIVSEPSRPDPTRLEVSSEIVNAFLNQSHPRPLIGPWQCGWSLGFHSRFSGSDWSRSASGDLVYRLKYQGDLDVVDELVEQARQLFTLHPELAQVDCLAPVPPTVPRERDPMEDYWKALGKVMNLPVESLLYKTRLTRPQKEMHSLAQKHANVAGAFGVKGDVRGRRILVVDDMYDSGATLEAITRLLQDLSIARVCVFTLSRTIHSDS